MYNYLMLPSLSMFFDGAFWNVETRVEGKGWDGILSGGFGKQKLRMYGLQTHWTSRADVHNRKGLNIYSYSL